MIIPMLGLGGGISVLQARGYCKFKGPSSLGTVELWASVVLSNSVKAKKRKWKRIDRLGHICMEYFVGEPTESIELPYY